MPPATRSRPIHLGPERLGCVIRFDRPVSGVTRLSIWQLRRGIDAYSPPTSPPDGQSAAANMPGDLALPGRRLTPTKGGFGVLQVGAHTFVVPGDVESVDEGVVALDA